MNRHELIKVLNLLLDHVADVHGVEAVDLADRDHYWATSDAWLDMDKVPDVVVGSLTEDVAALRLLLDDPSRASLLDLERFASVLRYMSDQPLRER